MSHDSDRNTRPDETSLTNTQSRKGETRFHSRHLVFTARKPTILYPEPLAMACSGAASTALGVDYRPPLFSDLPFPELHSAPPHPPFVPHQFAHLMLRVLMLMLVEGSVHHTIGRGAESVAFQTLAGGICISSSVAGSEDAKGEAVGIRGTPSMVFLASVVLSIESPIIARPSLAAAAAALITALPLLI